MQTDTTSQTKTSTIPYPHKMPHKLDIARPLLSNASDRTNTCMTLHMCCAAESIPERHSPGSPALLVHHHLRTEFDVLPSIPTGLVCFRARQLRYDLHKLKQFTSQVRAAATICGTKATQIALL